METDKDIIEMAVEGLTVIKGIAEKLTTGNVAHNGRTIAGTASRYIKYFDDYLAEREQWQPISELKNEMDENKIWIKTETGKVFRFVDDNLPMEEVTHFMIKD